MRPHAGLVLLLFAAWSLGAPLALGLWDGLRLGGSGASRPPSNWRLPLASALAYALAFTAVFLAQELALVVAKALTPGLHPVLFHNNHDWTGANPVAKLLQGAGVLADLAIGLAACAVLARRPPVGPTAYLLIFWSAYAGLFQGLPQAVAGAALPGNDLGMAMDYLRLPLPAMWAAAALAVAAMAFAGLWLGARLLPLAQTAETATPDGRARFIFRTATLPAIAGVALILPYRWPGALDQVAIVPAVVTVLGLAWMQAGAWRAARPASATEGHPRLLGLVAAALALLALCQFVLRPGVPF